MTRVSAGVVSRFGAQVIHPEGEPYEDFVIRCMNFVKSHASDAGSLQCRVIESTEDNVA